MRQESFQRLRAEVDFFTPNKKSGVADLLLSPDALEVCDAVEHLLRRKARAHFEDFDVVRTDNVLEAREVDHAGAGGAVVAAGKLDIVNVEAGELLGHRFEMENVIDETEV